jgi:hypothetical protein
MEGQEGPAPTNPSAKDAPLCEECKANPSKYKCPGCSVRSCSLPCVKAHKQRAGCTGKRNQTQFVPLSQFDDNLLVSGTFLCQLLCFFFEFRDPFVCWVGSSPIPRGSLLFWLRISIPFSRFHGVLCE